MTTLTGKIEAQKESATADISAADAASAAGFASVTAQIKAMDSKMTMNTQKVSGEVIAFKAFQHTVNVHVSAEINRVEKLMNAQHSESIKARGKLRAILDENKRAAHDEVTALDGLFKEKIAEIRSKAAEDAKDAADDLTAATEKMYESMEEVQRTNIYKNQEHTTAIEEYDASSTAAIEAAKADFNDRLDMLTNVVAADHKKVERNFEVLTGVVRDFKEAGEDERELIRKQNDAMNADMLKKIDVAIQLGEAKAKAVAQRARESLKGTSTALLIEITDTVEEYADKTFELIQGNQQVE